MSSIRALPLWVRYVFTFAVAAGLFAALAVFVSGHNGPLAESAASSSPSQARQTAIENYRLAVQQEAPQRVRVGSAAAPGVAAGAAVDAFFAHQTAAGFLPGRANGPARCAARGGRSAGRLAFGCNVFSGSGDNELRYPFAVVVAPRAHEVTFCQIITPAYPSYPSDTVPVPAACR